MKNRALQILAAILITAGSGVAIHNFTGTDITLPNGDVVSTEHLTESLTQHYALRNIDDSLYITIHHTAGPIDQSLESIAKYHVENRGWPAIAYHIAINSDGDINFLNDIERRTYHDSGENTRSIGIVLIGNYQVQEPTEAMLKSIHLVTEALCKSLKIKGIRGHRDTSPTLCPGKYAYDDLKTMFY